MILWLNPADLTILRKDNMIPGSTWFLSPVDVRFTYDSISDHFQPFIKNGQLRRLSILDCVQEFLQLESGQLLSSDGR